MGSSFDLALSYEKKLEWLEEESLREQKRDRMEQDYSFQLYRTKNIGK